MSTLPQDIYTKEDGTWVEPVAWTTGADPTSQQDAFLGDPNSSSTISAQVDSESSETVNSIGTDAESQLEISDGSTFIATDGTTVNPSDSYVLASGNAGYIVVDPGATLEMGDAVVNTGTLYVGYGASTGSTPLGYLKLLNVTTLSGGGVLDLGGIAGTTYDGEGNITGIGLVNVNNTIEGSGEILLGSFDNQAKGVVLLDANSMEIASQKMSNEGAITMESSGSTFGALELGQSGLTETLANAGTMSIDYGGELFIGGSFTIAGKGHLAMKGAGSAILAESGEAATFINDSTIEAVAVGVERIGEGALNIVNGGVIAVSGASVHLVITSGTAAILDGGGTLEALNDGALDIYSNVLTGAPTNAVGGTIEAASGGVVNLTASVTDGVASPSLSGQVIIDAGTVEIQATGSVAIPIAFTGGAGTLEIYGDAAPTGAISGLAVDDAFELAGGAITAFTIGANSVTLTTNIAAYDFAAVGFSGSVDGFVAWADTTTQLERVTFTDGAATTMTEFGWTFYVGHSQISLQKDGSDTIDFVGTSGNLANLAQTNFNWDAVNGTGGIIDLSTAQTNVTGGSDTINFSGGVNNETSLYGTSEQWDAVNGSGGIIDLTSAQTNVTGGSDTINFSGGVNNETSLYNTGQNWDAVNGAGGIIYLTSAQASVSGGGDSIDFAGGSGDAASLYNTGGAWDGVTGGAGLIYLTSAQASITGGGDTIDIAGGSGNAASLYGSNNDWDAFNGSSGLVYLTNSQSNVTGSLDTIDFQGATGNAVSLYGTAGSWDTVNGSSGTIYLTSAQTSVIGGGDAITFAGAGDIASLASTGAAGDTVNGNGGVIDLYGVAAKATGSGDTLNFYDSDTATLSAGTELLVFAQGIGGQDSIAGVASTDTLQFSKTDFANYAALASHMKVSGGNTVITLNSTDVVTVVGVTNLTASQFTFV